MAHELQGLIDQAEASEFSHIVVGVTEEGIRWRTQTESACKTIALVLGEEWKVLTKEQFLADLHRIVDEDEQASHKEDMQ
jgi:hypothetical protein